MQNELFRLFGRCGRRGRLKFPIRFLQSEPLVFLQSGPAVGVQRGRFGEPRFTQEGRTVEIIDAALQQGAAAFGGSGFHDGVVIGQTEVRRVGTLDEDFLAYLAFGLEAAKVRFRLLQHAMGVGAGALDRFEGDVDLRVVGFEGIYAGSEADSRCDIRFGTATTAEQPLGAAEFFG